MPPHSSNIHGLFRTPSCNIGKFFMKSDIFVLDHNISSGSACPQTDISILELLILELLNRAVLAKLGRVYAGGLFRHFQGAVLNAG
jgi:hypothetical protein